MYALVITNLWYTTIRRVGKTKKNMSMLSFFALIPFMSFAASAVPLTLATAACCLTAAFVGHKFSLRTVVKRAKEHDEFMAKLKSQREESERKHEEFLLKQMDRVVTDEEVDALLREPTK